MAKKAKKSAPKPAPKKKEKPGPKDKSGTAKKSASLPGASTTSDTGDGSRRKEATSSGTSSSKREPASTSPIEPARKVVVVSGEDQATVLRLPSLLGTLYSRKAAARSKRGNAHKERDDLHNQISDLGLEVRAKKHPKHSDYLELRRRHGEKLDEIKGLADEINAYECAQDDIGRECAEGRLKFAEKSLDELLKDQATKPKTETNDGQMELGDVVPPGPNSSWMKIIRFKDFFKGKPEKDVKTHLAVLEQMNWGVVPVGNPVALAGYMNTQFHRIAHADPSAATESRAGIMPKSPEWFMDGLWDLMLAALKGELGDGSEAQTLEAENVENAFRAMMEKDIEAWILLVGRDSDLNKHLNKAA